MAIRYLSKTALSQLAGTALVRLDLNDDGWRLTRALPTLTKLRRGADKLVLISHRGRPVPSSVHPDNRKLSLESWIKPISSLLKCPVIFLSHLRLSEAASAIRRAPASSVFLLENMRFLAGEQENDKELARHLASLADYYVNEAFAASHRRHVSVAGLPEFLPSLAGFNLEAEIIHLTKAIKSARHPLVLILGGAKIMSKIGVLANFRRRADTFLIGGAIANTLLYLQGVPVGRSLVEKEIDGALLSLAKMKNLVLPSDFRRAGTSILDVGPKTEKIYLAHLQKAKTVIWNGPLGQIEKPAFAGSTRRLARALAASRAYSVVGGGETVTVIRRLKLENQFSFVSTGGGAMLEFLAGQELPGLKALGKSR